MKRILYVIITLIMVLSLLTHTESAASLGLVTPAPELGQLKVCKVAGAGVTEGRVFTFKVDNNSYSVPAGPGEGGFCVLAGQYPVDTEVTVQEEIPAGYYVARIEAKPDNLTSKDVGQGIAIVNSVSGVTEVIFTNRAIGSPPPTHEPTPIFTSTPRPTNTPPDCAPNCTPTPTPIPRGRLQICKEADGAGVSGNFTFNYAGRSVTIPAGACSCLIGVDAGPLTITEETQAGYSVTDIYTIPADRLISENHNTRKAKVTIVEGYAASQTIVVFRNQAGPPTTGTPRTPTVTATPSRTPSACVPTVVDPDFSQVAVGGSVEGLGTVDPQLNIDAKGTAIHVLEGSIPSVYASIVNGVPLFNAGMVASGGFSDLTTKTAFEPHRYTFSFAPGVAVSNFTLRMLDFGDFNPSGSTSHLVTMTAYGANNAVVTSQQLSYTSVGGISPTYGNMMIAGDAIDATPGQPGNWTWNVSGNGIVRLVLEFGAGYDPNMGLDIISFTIDCP